MPGASDRTLRVRFLNMNWTSRAHDAAAVEALVVTEDEARHTLVLRTDEVAGFAAMVRASPVLLLDPEGPTVIAANIVGNWLPEDWSGRERSS